MIEEKMNQEVRLKKIDEIRNQWIEEINRNELMSKERKKNCRVLNYLDQSLIAISIVTGCASISAFASLDVIPIGITSSAIGLKIWLITAEIERYKSMTKKKRKKHEKICC